MSANLQNILDTILIDKINVLVSGLAGTGKSFMLKKIFKHIQKEHPNDPIFKTAPTGIASVNIKGQTIFSWAGMGLFDKSESYYISNIYRKYPTAVTNLKMTSYLIIDEISMINPTFFSKLDTIAKYVRQDNRPFGGIILIMFGDMAQLEPISKDKDDPIKFVFQTNVWSKMPLFRMWLRKIYRQANDQAYVQLLDRVRHGTITSDDVKLLRSKLIRKLPVAKITFDADGVAIPIPLLLTTHAVNVDLYNQKKLKEVADSQNERLKLFVPIINIKHDEDEDGQPSTTKILQSDIGKLEDKFPIYNVRLCKNAQVLMRCNALIKDGICNGTMGIVDRIEPNKIYVRFMVDGELTEPIKIARYRYILKINSGKVHMDQFPLSVAYAATIHRCQGLTLDSAIVDIRRVFANSMVYVALSRIRSLDGLQLLGNFDTRYFKSNPDALVFEKDPGVNVRINVPETSTQHTETEAETLSSTTESSPCGSTGN
jgi:ATP-dependent DNA helicase PIF1